VGYPDVCPSVTCNTPLDPSTNNIFDLMTGLWSEVTGNASSKGIFPDNYIHLGGDEVSTDCWSSTPRIQAWMTQKGFTPDQTYMYIVEQAHNIVSSMGRHPINWEEVFNHFGSKLDKATIIHIWLDHATLAKVVAAGYQASTIAQDHSMGLAFFHVSRRTN
jgi:hexosaminidase